MSSTDITGPMLVIIRGVPGTGKSYLAGHVAGVIGQAAVVMLDPDAIDKDSDDYRVFAEALSADGVDAKLHPFRYLRHKAYEGITDGKVIIWNQPFTDFDGLHKTIGRLTEYAQDHGIQLPVLVVEVEIDAETAMERVTARKAQGGHGPDDELMKKFISDYRSFAGEGYSIVTIDGRADVAQSADNVIVGIRGLLEA